MLFFVAKKHRENGKSTGKIQGKHREFGLDQSVATLFHAPLHILDLDIQYI